MRQPNSRIAHDLTRACECRGARGPEADAQAWPGSAPGVSPGAAAALADGVRPWHHSMATQQVAPEDEEAARRRFAAEVAAGGWALGRIACSLARWVVCCVQVGGHKAG